MTQEVMKLKDRCSYVDGSGMKMGSLIERLHGVEFSRRLAVKLLGGENHRFELCHFFFCEFISYVV